MAVTIARRSGCPLSAATTRPTTDAVPTGDAGVAGRALVSRGGITGPGRGSWMRGGEPVVWANSGAVIGRQQQPTSAIDAAVTA